MGRSWWLKFLVMCGLSAAAILYIVPTVARLDPETSKFFIKQKVNLGLDLQGGLYLVLGVDFDKVFQEVVQRQSLNVEGYFKDKGVSVQSVRVIKEGFAKDDTRIRVTFDPARKDEIHSLIKKEFSNLRVTADESTYLDVGLSPTYRKEVREKTRDQSIEVIRNRIDEFGVSEPSITSQGDDRVIVELPGIRQVERAKSLIGQTAKLEFRIVADEKMSVAELEKLIEDAEKSAITFTQGDKFSEYIDKLNEFAKKKLPEGTSISFERPKDQLGNTSADNKIPFLLYDRADVTGEDLLDAYAGFDPQDRRPLVYFSMNPRGAPKFGTLTKENIKKRMAIVLDGIVISAPVIESQIVERGQISLGRGNVDQVLKEAQDLSIVLRAGALPAQLEFLEQRVIGPSLGEDSIREGATATLIGSILVFLFILIYYKVSGIIAAISLVLNVIFVMACLVGLEATLTLPGIAGIALTVGIAVDSNVIIYERIREEIMAGKNIFAAVEAGFQKALSAIIDANLTNACAAVVLFMFGTGAIKGFAVTLMIGIVTTLFTAVFVCKVLFELYLRIQENRGSNHLSI